MTSEVAIMNKQAVALAADSAVTMLRQGEQKVFTSANKLFRLSKYYPIGIMVYGSAEFMGVPWETIIKIYRAKLGKQNFDILEQYAENFIAFLDDGNALFPEAQQEQYLSTATHRYFIFIREKKIAIQVKSILKQQKKITKTQVAEIVSDTINQQYKDLESREMLPSIPQNHDQNLLNKYASIIDKAAKQVFQKLPLSNGALNQLRRMGGSLFCKDIFPRETISGVVIAGFGEQDTFPSLRTFEMEGIAKNKLKYRVGKKQLRGIDEITFEKSAAIIAFAQRDTVTAFMEGIEPSYRTTTETYLSEIFNKYPEIIAQSIEKLSNDEKRSLEKELKDVSNTIFEDYKKRIKSYEIQQFVHRVVSTVAMLPKDELAAMAETLVNLTSFKLKVTAKTETVGGPIDVALISKGDGFVWIKRKHYFKPELNPQFFANYFREMEDENK